MSVAVDAPPPAPSAIQQLARVLPGIVLLGIVGYAGKITEQSIAAYGRAHHLTLPNIEYVLWAIVFGLVVSNTVGVPRVCEAGIETYEFWLKIGIVLLGVRFLLGDVARLGGVSLLCVVLELAVSIAVMTALGRAFRLPPKLTSLLAIGASICGVSAIIAAKGAIEADDEDASYAIAAILALGAISLVVFPVVGHALGMSDHAYGLWVGLAVDNTAEATAAGALYSDAAGRFAVLAKTTRNATIGFDARRVHAAADRRHREPLAAGVPPHVRGDRAAHQPARDRAAGVAAARRWRRRRVRDCRAHARDDRRRGAAVPRLTPRQIRQRPSS